MVAGGALGVAIGSVILSCVDDVLVQLFFQNRVIYSIYIQYMFWASSSLPWQA